MPIKNEYDYLIHLLSSAVNETVPEDIPDGLSYEKVLELSMTHLVANIAFAAVQKLRTPPEKAVFDHWKFEYEKAVIRDANQKAIHEEILNALHSHGICTLEVQGTVVKNYYPQSHLRLMSDIDFIVPPEKFGELEEIMQGIGYITKALPESKEVDAVKNHQFIELHTEFFEDFHTASKALSRPFDHAVINDDLTASVSDTVFYLYHILHTLKHATELKGIGIRRVIDLFYLENALKDKVDYAYIDRVLKKCGMLKAKELLFAVKDHWFCGIEPKTDISAFEREILRDGDAGTDEIYFKNIFANKRAQGKHFVKLRYVLSRIFPPKKAIYREYPFCEKHRYPTVLCWLHRWLLLPFGAGKLKKLKTLVSILRVKTK